MVTSSAILPKGSTFVRAAIAKAITGATGEADSYAEGRWGVGNAASRITRAAVPPASMGSGGWGAELAEYAAAAREFTALVTEASVVGRLPGLRRVPLQLRLITQTSGLLATWVREGLPVPMGRMVFGTDTLGRLKVGALTAVTNESLEASEPSIEDIIRGDLSRAMSAAVDLAFLDPANGGVVDEKPASITFGAPTTDVGGGDVNDAIVALVAGFQGDLSRAVFVGSPEAFAGLLSPIHPNVGLRGGELVGAPAVSSNGLPPDTLVLLDPSGIVFGADVAEISTATHASVEMLDTGLVQDSATGTGTVLVPLWQSNLTALMGRLFCDWRVARAGSVSLLTGLPVVPAS